jgi:hypothetical protein
MQNLRPRPTAPTVLLAVALLAGAAAAAPAAPKAAAPAAPAAAKPEGPQAADKAPAAKPEGPQAADKAPAAKPEGAAAAEPTTDQAQPEAAKAEAAAPAEPDQAAVAPKPEPVELVPTEPQAPPPPAPATLRAAPAQSPEEASAEQDRVAAKKAPGEFLAAVLLTYQPAWNTHRGYDLFDDDNVGHFWGLAASYDLAQVADRTALFVDLGWATSSLEQSLPEAFQHREMTTHEVAAGVGAHCRVLPQVGPHARLAVGIWRWKATLEGDVPGERFEDDGVAPFVRLGAGVSAEQTVGARVALGVLAEGGYTLASGAAIELNPVDLGDSVSTDTAELGTLKLSGAYLRFAGLMRF